MQRGSGVKLAVVILLGLAVVLVGAQAGKPLGWAGAGLALASLLVQLLA